MTMIEVVVAVLIAHFLMYTVGRVLRERGSEEDEDE
jgi:hypothetical protein